MGSFDLKLNHFAIQVEICSDEYLPIRLDLSSERTRQALLKSGTIFVKKRTSYKNKVCSISNQQKIHQNSDNFISSCWGVASLLVAMALER